VYSEFLMLCPYEQVSDVTFVTWCLSGGVATLTETSFNVSHDKQVVLVTIVYAEI